MSSRFDVCLLLYVIRLAGWLKHCNLSLPPYHTSEGKGRGLLGCGTAKAFPIAVWQHSQPQTLPTAKHPCTLSAVTLRIVGHAYPTRRDTEGTDCFTVYL